MTRPVRSPGCDHRTMFSDTPCATSTVAYQVPSCSANCRAGWLGSAEGGDDLTGRTPAHAEVHRRTQCRRVEEHRSTQACQRLGLQTVARLESDFTHAAAAGGASEQQIVGHRLHRPKLMQVGRCGRVRSP